MSIKRSIKDNIHIFYFTAPDGRISRETHIKDISQQLDSGIEAVDGGKLIMNFKGITMMSSPMISELLKVKKKCDKKGINLKFCSLDQNVESALKAVRLDKIFTIVSNEKKALASYGSIKRLGGKAITGIAVAAGLVLLVCAFFGFRALRQGSAVTNLQRLGGQVVYGKPVIPGGGVLPINFSCNAVAVKFLEFDGQFKSKIPELTSNLRAIPGLERVVLRDPEYEGFVGEFESGLPWSRIVLERVD